MFDPCLVVLFVAVSPEVAELLNADGFVLELATAFFGYHPLDVVVGGKEHLEEHDGCRVHSDCDQDYPFFCLTRHEEVDVEEDEGEDSIIE